MEHIPGALNTSRRHALAQAHSVLVVVPTSVLTQAHRGYVTHPVTVMFFSY